MLINIWSTPRTGSVWYAHYIRSTIGDATVLREPFNTLRYNTYHRVNDDGSISSDLRWSRGAHVDHLCAVDGIVKEHQLYSNRVVDIDKETERRLGIIKERDRSQTLIMQNHIDSTSSNVVEYCIANGRNIWIYRKDRRAQLASFAIAIATKKFTSYGGRNQHVIDLTDTIDRHLTRLIERIAIWDRYDKSGGELVAFEDIKFFERDGFPRDQNINVYDAITDRVAERIDKLVSDYEANR